MLQHEGLYVGPHHAVHLLSLLWAGNLHQADQHIQCTFHQYAAVAVGMRDDGCQDGQNPRLQWAPQGQLCSVWTRLKAHITVLHHCYNAFFGKAVQH